MRDKVSGLFSQINSATLLALHAAGWYPERSIDVSSEIQTLEALGYVASPVIAEFLESLRGLKIAPAREDGPNFINSEPFYVEPLGAGARHKDEAAVIDRVMGGESFPIGWWLSYSHVFMRQDGALAAYANGMVWNLGDTPADGVNLMVSADRPLVCVYAPEGMKPWPRNIPWPSTPAGDHF